MSNLNPPNWKSRLANTCGCSPRDASGRDDLRANSARQSEPEHTAPVACGQVKEGRIWGCHGIDLLATSAMFQADSSKAKASAQFACR